MKYLEMRETIRDLSDPQHLQDLIASKREIEEGNRTPSSRQRKQ